jgi:hypothetical protein
LASSSAHSLWPASPRHTPGFIGASPTPREGANLTSDIPSGTYFSAYGTETCGDADDVFFDERRRRIYVSCGSGNVAVLQDGYGGCQTIMLLPTATGARTSLFVPELDRLFVAQRAGLLGGGAEMLVLRPQNGRAD